MATVPHTPGWLSPTGATLMAVVNLNTDSFSDPRDAHDPTERLSAARRAVAAGADLVDLGAQSAALAAAIVPAADQVDVLVPVVTALHADGIAVSVDTYDIEVTRAVLAAGADVVNDFSGNVDPDIIAATAEAGAWYVLTHNPVGPRRRQSDDAFYDDVVDHVLAFFERELTTIEAQGLSPDRVLLDPGVDVGKTPAQTLDLLRGWERIRLAFDQPQLWAISRKDVLGALTGRRPAERDAATLALLAMLAGQPRTLARVHDVAASRDVLAVAAAVAGHRGVEPGLLDDDLRREA